MGLYSNGIFPRLCDLLLNRPLVAQHRQQLLAMVCGELLEVGFGTGLNLPHYPIQVRRITTVDPNNGSVTGSDWPRLGRGVVIGESSSGGP